MSTAGPIHITITASSTVAEQLDVAVICSHPEAYIEKACCSTPGSSGMIECGCGGQDSVVCPNPKCQGIDDNEVDQLFDRLAGDREEDLT